MQKIEVSYYLETIDDLHESLGSAKVCYIPQIGGRIFLKEDGWDFKKNKKLSNYKVDGQYIVKEIHQIIRNKIIEIEEGEFKGMPQWETKEMLEIILVEIDNYVR